MNDHERSGSGFKKEVCVFLIEEIPGTSKIGF